MEAGILFVGFVNTTGFVRFFWEVFKKNSSRAVLQPASETFLISPWRFRTCLSLLYPGIHFCKVPCTWWFRATTVLESTLIRSFSHSRQKGTAESAQNSTDTVSGTRTGYFGYPKKGVNTLNLNVLIFEQVDYPTKMSICQIECFPRGFPRPLPNIFLSPLGLPDVSNMDVENLAEPAKPDPLSTGGIGTKVETSNGEEGKRKTTIIGRSRPKRYAEICGG